MFLNKMFNLLLISYFNIQVQSNFDVISWYVDMNDNNTDISNLDNIRDGIYIHIFALDHLRYQIMEQ